MTLVDEIQSCFSKGYFGRAMKIEGLPDEYPAWSVKDDKWIGVAIPMTVPIDFSESFSSVQISCESGAKIGDRDYTLLLLKCFIMESRNQFANVCADFVDPGENGENRNRIIENPEQWWNSWKILLGNVDVNDSAYDVLGELLMYEKLINNGYDITWSGIGGGTVDLESPDFAIEVKSSLQRYGYFAKINSIYQLTRNKKDLYLCFLRFEKSSMGISLDDVVSRLDRHKTDIDQIEKMLVSMKLEKGKSARKERYKILEWLLYPVDDSFPVITENSFKDNRIPQGIVRMTYTVDLSALTGKNLKSEDVK